MERAEFKEEEEKSSLFFPFLALSIRSFGIILVVFLVIYMHQIRENIRERIFIKKVSVCFYLNLNRE
jgi:hypothetical protein